MYSVGRRQIRLFAMAIATLFAWFVSLFIPDEMVEVLSTSFQNLYKKYARPENAAVQGGGRDEVYIAPVNTARNDADNDYQEQQQQQQQLRYGSKSRKPFAFDVRRLCAVKTDKWNVLTVNTRRPLVGKCCSVCIPHVLKEDPKFDSTVINLLDVYNIGSFFKKSVFGSSVDNLMFFYRQKTHRYKYIFDEVLEDEVVLNVMNEAVQKALADDITTVDRDSQRSIELKIQQEKTKRILTVMSANVKNWVYKVIGWFTYRMVSLFSTSLLVQPQQIDRVREAEQSGLRVIYLPLHKSHMDYILLGLVLTMHNIRPPLVAGGDNLRVFFISKLLSFLGAFYIERQVDTKQDKLYWSILNSYIKNSMKCGHHIEFFLEGGRTRSGKCCVPKAGLLSIIVDAYREGVIEDAWIIPVSMNYDRLLEGNFVREQLGQSKKKETFFMAISSFIKAIFSHYGIMKIDFNVPYRLRDLYESIDKITKLENEVLRIDGMEIMSENALYKRTVDGMAKHIVYDCWKSLAIMSTNAVCFLLLKKFRNGTTVEKLALELSLLRDELSQAGRDTGFSGDSVDVVKHALNLLVPKLVVYEKTDLGVIVKPILTVPSLIELSYYGNSLLSHYLHQSLVAMVLSKLVCPEFWIKILDETRVSRNELLGDLSFLIELLQFDFVFSKPCDTLDTILDSVIRKFELEGIILVEMLLDEEKRSQNLAKQLESDSDDDYDKPHVPYDINYRINATENSLNKLKFYRSIMMPYLECMAESAGSFYHVVDDAVSEREHVQTILTQMQGDWANGVLMNGESISIDTIKHSFLAFEKFNCLQITVKDNVKMLSLIDNEFNQNFRENISNMALYIQEFLTHIN